MPFSVKQPDSSACLQRSCKGIMMTGRAGYRNALYYWFKQKLIKPCIVGLVRHKKERVPKKEREIYIMRKTEEQKLRE